MFEGLTKSANNWALEWQLEDIKRNVLKRALHWVRSFLYNHGRFFFVSLVSPGLSKILVELAGRSIQSREIGAALSVRTCALRKWFIQGTHYCRILTHQLSFIFFPYLPLLPTSCSAKHNHRTISNCLSSQQSQYQQMFYYMKNNFTTLDSRP